ncbi:phosphotransferase [Pseudochelatococcus contaminans]|uniref:Hydroxylysine kinase n=1 Tax=Pseudochelatococcus contaminans TaxID=1538103 RepID=A0A7W5Z1B6_9HYPH|nr:Ser/Thr protein kinase RdoA (MazF antagonist) [Pseudochelatococcus contaminans]
MTTDTTGNTETLASPPPAMTQQEAVRLARTLFGLPVEQAELMTAERDQNLRLTAADGQRWVMKVANSAEDREVTDFQTAALCHVERTTPDLPVPRVQRSVSGKTEVLARLSDGRCSVVRVLSWMDGLPLVHAPRSARQRRNLACCHARLGRAFAGFSHPGQEHYLQWDISNLDRVAPLLLYVEGDDIRAMVAGVLTDFRREAKPALPDLRRQVIYNDLNFHNVLVDPYDPDRIAGIIDFGDIIAAPLVNDLAVAASYQFGSAGVRADVAEFIAAYHRQLPLTGNEIRLLPLLIEARLAMTLLITGYRAIRYPENADYILRNNMPARVALAEMRSRSPQDNAEWVNLALENSR